MNEIHKWSKEAEEEFKDFTIDHLKHFDALPITFMDSTGKEYGVIDCWVKALELNLVQIVRQQGASI